MVDISGVGKISYSALTIGQKWLLEKMQFYLNGRIENLVIRNGEPDPSQPPRLCREVKFGGKGLSRRRRKGRDFNIKDEVEEMFMEFRKLRNGVVSWIEFRDGLPFRMSVEETIGK